MKLYIALLLFTIPAFGQTKTDTVKYVKTYSYKTIYEKTRTEDNSVLQERLKLQYLDYDIDSVELTGITGYKWSTEYHWKIVLRKMILKKTIIRKK